MIDHEHPACQCDVVAVPPFACGWGQRNPLLWKEIPYCVTIEGNPFLEKEIPYYRRKSLTIEGNPLLYKKKVPCDIERNPSSASSPLGGCPRPWKLRSCVT